MIEFAALALLAVIVGVSFGLVLRKVHSRKEEK